MGNNMKTAETDEAGRKVPNELSRGHRVAELKSEADKFKRGVCFLLNVFYKTIA